ncbi:hypothetical protein GQ44DRAFT_780265 [Phaeosphaeriaceae sp. PMI808]|nr:hypothetical protein GQ44DRAFT_780265 [Phaeosphaeriaceae sp. PMI808]
MFEEVQAEELAIMGARGTAVKAEKVEWDTDGKRLWGTNTFVQAAASRRICGGGSGNCVGCNVKPILCPSNRAPGLDGKDGGTAVNLTNLLLNGLDGVVGIVTIVVQHDQHTTRRYTSPWSLELVSFEVEDSNADGIFEPEEYLHIWRVTVRNIGGMPSPTCRTPVRLADHSDHFEEVSAEDGGIAYLPTSIPSMGEASMEGLIRVRIKPSMSELVPGIRFFEKAWLQIRADMPWLERRMPSFDLRKEIDISYPCGLGTFDHLNKVAQSVMSRIDFKVINFSNQPIGENKLLTGRHLRLIETVIHIPPVFGRLISPENEDQAQFDKVMPLIWPRDSTCLQQQFRILSTAEDHKNFPVAFSLYLEAPQQPRTDEGHMVLVDTRVVRLQVSSRYIHTHNARFLLVTNLKTTERQSQAIQEFIQTSLHMGVDLCNIHQNGRLKYLADDADKLNLEEPIPILQNYHKKTVIFLNDGFEFFGSSKKTPSQLCDPNWLRDLAVNNGSSLFIGTPKIVALKHGSTVQIWQIQHDARMLYTVFDPHEYSIHGNIFLSL